MLGLLGSIAVVGDLDVDVDPEPAGVIRARRVVAHVVDLDDRIDVGLVGLRCRVPRGHLELIDEREFAAKPLASGVPTVNTPEDRTGGLQDG